MSVAKPDSDPCRLFWSRLRPSRSRQRRRGSKAPAPARMYSSPFSVRQKRLGRSESRGRECRNRSRSRGRRRRRRRRRSRRLGETGPEASRDLDTGTAAVPQVRVAAVPARLASRSHKSASAADSDPRSLGLASGLGRWRPFRVRRTTRIRVDSRRRPLSAARLKPHSASAAASAAAAGGESAAGAVARGPNCKFSTGHSIFSW